MPSLLDWRKRIETKRDEKRYASRIIKTEEHELIRSRENLSHILEAQQILQTVAQSVQQQTHQRISTIVSKCLAIVYDKPYKFIIRFERKRGKTQAVLRLTRKGKEVDPNKAAGGGVADVVAFALRLACLSLRLPKLRHLIVMDEPFKHVDTAAQERIKGMLRVLATEMNFQFILSTHSNQLKTGKVVQLKRASGRRPVG